MKCQPYVSSKEPIRLMPYDISDTAKAPYFKPGRGKNKGRKVLGRVNEYTFQPRWGSARLHREAKVTAHRLFRHKVAQVLRTDPEGELIDRISVGNLY